MFFHLKSIIFSNTTKKFTDKLWIKTNHFFTLCTTHMLMMWMSIVNRFIFVVAFSKIDSTKNPYFTKGFQSSKDTCSPYVRKTSLQYLSRNKVLRFDKIKNLLPLACPSHSWYFHTKEIIFIDTWYQ